MKKPNILYLHSHDTGRYIQPYGYPVDTPNLSRLAEGGVLFRKAFCTAPTCSPSRASLVTGQMPHNNGMLGLAHRGFFLDDYSKHIIHTLKSVGYHSVLCGVQHIADDAGKIGYDEVIDLNVEREGESYDKVAPKAVEVINEIKEPFFLSVGFSDTHRPFGEISDKDNPDYCMPPAPVADTPETRKDFAAFKSRCRDLDTGMGEVIDAIEKRGLSENTLIICTTDHGIAFPYMKCNLTDHGTGVMLIMKGPCGFEGGKINDALVSQLDIYPTVCEILQIDKPNWLQGKSMLPLIQEQSDEINKEIFGEINYHAAYQPVRSVRTKRWKYIVHLDFRKKPVLPNIDDGPSKSLWLKNGYANCKIEQEQLYDLILDPCEMNNLAGRDEYQPVLKDMKKSLIKWMRKTGDPFLDGQIPKPDSAELNNVDGISPQEPLV
jgi:arylsulfatase A-like enzyme